MKIFDDVRILIGDKKINNICFNPFDKNIINFLDDLSKDILKNKICNNYPDLISASFFCRKSNINNFKSKLLSKYEIRKGRGLAFHIAPSNVPLNFFYSMIFGLLCGNSNIIKISSLNFAQVEIICLAMKKLLKKKYKFINKFIKIIQYNYKNTNITEKLSHEADVRIIWGGDNTIYNLRKYKTNPRTVDICFADRYSMSIINLDEISNLNSFGRKKLLLNFYNDTLTLDQNACSSPHLILWYGKKKISKSIFWLDLSEIIKERSQLDETIAINKYSRICKSLILNNEKIYKFKNYQNYLGVISLKKLNQEVTNLRGQWGFFYEVEIDNLNSLNRIDCSKIQTLTYFGFKKNNINKFIIQNNLKGIDRIVPIGQAFNIDFIWDGYNVYNYLTRVIDVK